jgi:hypothetical protein
MITSGCTGWDPNAARLLTGRPYYGQWTLHPNPCKGEDAQLTFHSQSTFILPVQGKENAFYIYGRPLETSEPYRRRYIWLPILFENGLPVLKWFDKWDLGIFDKINADTSVPKEVEGYKLVWNDEFDNRALPTGKCGLLRKALPVTMSCSGIRKKMQNAVMAFW